MTSKANKQNFNIPKHLRNLSDLEQGLMALRQIDASLIPFIDGHKDIDLRWCPAGFEGLSQIIVAQQVSRASATAMMQRLQKLLVPFEATKCLELGTKILIEAGLSRAKQATLLGLAHEIVDNNLDLEALTHRPPAESMQILTDLKGIGPWTAELFLMFCAGHIDIFPTLDIALQQAIMDIGITDTRPNAEETAIIAERWQPIRSVAARVLWATYARNRK